MTRAGTVLLAAVALLAGAASGQGQGVTLLGHVDAYPQYNDVWGITALDGREFAILGTRNGTAFYDCSNPAAPALTGFIPGPTSTWRDMKTFGRYCYIVTEGGGGMQIVDLNNPDQPTLVGTWGTTLWGDAHNIAIDEPAAMAYVCGTNVGMLAIDLSNPVAPVHVATYGAAYVHDLQVQNGVAHLARIQAGDYARVSTAALPSWPLLGSAPTPGSKTHTAWADPTDSFAVTTDETAGGGLAFYDITGGGNPQLLSTWSLAGATVHNAAVRGDRVYASWYTAGLVVLDAANPAAPTLVGSYDTSPLSGSGYDGAWGVYPFTQNGWVFVSDIDEGLFILRVDGPALALQHQPLPDTLDEQGPYPVIAEVQAVGSGNTVAAVEVRWSVDGGPQQVAPMAPTGNPDEWAAGIPGQPSPAVVAYRVVATDSNGVERSDPPQGDHLFRVGLQVPVLAEDFEGPGDAGWTHAQVATQDDWQRGAPQGKSGDPSGAYGGLACWGNDLGPAGWNGAYQPNVDNWLQSPPADCSGRSGMRLRFARWLTVEKSQYDVARILVNGQEAWRNPYAADLVDTAWSVQDLDVSQWADGQAAVTIRFQLQSDGGLEYGGWNIDDFELYALEPSPPAVDALTLAGPATATVGQAATWTVSGMQPGAPWWLAASPSNAGQLFQGHAFEVGLPVFLPAQGLADAAGTAAPTLVVPPTAAGLTLYLEAASRPALGVWQDSNLLTVVVP